jgi:hypothetical protein
VVALDEVGTVNLPELVWVSMETFEDSNNESGSSTDMESTVWARPGRGRP